MTRRTSLRLLFAVAVLAALVFPTSARAHTNFFGPGIDGCAFEDVNDNGVFDADTDTAVTDARWLGGVAYVSSNPFVVPTGCAHTLASGPAITNGIRVTATKITFLGTLEYLPAGGKGIFLRTLLPVGPALGDGSITIGDGVTKNVRITAGGQPVVPTTALALTYYKSLAIWSAGACTVSGAEVRGTSPTTTTGIGMLCNSDIVFRGATLVASRIAVQSLSGKIDARSFTLPAGPTFADLCDDPAVNPLSGNDDGIPDFPCQLHLGAASFLPALAPGVTPVFADREALKDFALATPVAGTNRFQAINDWVMMVSGAGVGTHIDMRGVAGGGETTVSARFGIRLIAPDGNILARNAIIENKYVPTPTGATVYLFANPATVLRYVKDHETIYAPCTGNVDLTGAAISSPNAVQVCGTLSGTPPCPSDVACQPIGGKRF